MVRKETSSTLFSSTWGNAYQFLGMELDGSTGLRIHLPLFLRVADFKLSGRYSSKTTSNVNFEKHLFTLPCKPDCVILYM